MGGAAIGHSNGHGLGKARCTAGPLVAQTKVGSDRLDVGLVEGGMYCTLRDMRKQVMDL